MNRTTSWTAVLPSLVIPVCLGMSMFLGLKFAIGQELLTSPWALRYLEGHLVSSVTVAMFFVGIASLAMVCKNVAEQFWSLEVISLSTQSDEIDTAAAAEETTSQTPLLPSQQLAKELRSAETQLDACSDSQQHHYLWQRLKRAVESIGRVGSTAEVDDELKYLGESDLERQQSGYSLVRILIWATPMLGFLGTVLGISEALGGMNVGPDSDFQQMMDGLRGSLYVAFDTTALALTLSMVLMFLLFLVERLEGQLLQQVDDRARIEMSRCFDLRESNDELKKLTDEIVRANAIAVQQQVEIWKQTIANAESAWTASLTQANGLVQANLSDALEENVGNLSHYLGEAIGKADDAMHHRLQQWQVTLSENARLMSEQQQQLAEQASHLEAMLEREQGTVQLNEAVEQHQAAIASVGQLRKTIDRLNDSVESISLVSDPKTHWGGAEQPVKVAGSAHALIEVSAGRSGLSGGVTTKEPLTKVEDVAAAEDVKATEGIKAAEEKREMILSFEQAKADQTEANERRPQEVPPVVDNAQPVEVGSAEVGSVEVDSESGMQFDTPDCVLVVPMQSPEAEPTADLRGVDVPDVSVDAEVVIQFPGRDPGKEQRESSEQIADTLDRVNKFLSSRRSA